VGVGKPVVLLIALIAALTGPVGAREPDVPPSQAAFRAALTKYYEKCETETEQARFGELQRARATAFAQSLGEGLSFAAGRSAGRPPNLLETADPERSAARRRSFAIRSCTISSKP
jgi:hypothetical protein